MDFGTTNSGMATYDLPRGPRLPLIRQLPTHRVARTALYITNRAGCHIGRAAVDRYLNTTSAVRSKCRKSGANQIVADRVYFHHRRVFSPMPLARAAFSSRSRRPAGVELSIPVRSSARPTSRRSDPSRLFDEIPGRAPSASTGQAIRRVVLGRPVHFAADEAGTGWPRRACSMPPFAPATRLSIQQYEPVAAACFIARRCAGLTRPENARLDRRRHAGHHRHALAEKVPRAGGWAASLRAGDVFDQKFICSRQPRHFGEGSSRGCVSSLMQLHWI